MIRKVIEDNAGEAEYAKKKLTNGNLLVKVKRSDKVKSLLKMTQFHRCQEKDSIPINLTTCKGVIPCSDLKCVYRKKDHCIKTFVLSPILLMRHEKRHFEYFFTSRKSKVIHSFAIAPL